MIENSADIKNLYEKMTRLLNDSFGDISDFINFMVVDNFIFETTKRVADSSFGKLQYRELFIGKKKTLMVHINDHRAKLSKRN
jgi:hypothetical protein